MLTTHIDIEIYKDAKKKARRLCRKNFKEAFKYVDFIKFLTTSTNLKLYGVKNEVNTINLIHDDLFTGKEESERPFKDEKSFIEATVEVDDKKPYQLFFLNCEDKQKLFEKINHSTFLIGFFNDYAEVFKKFNSDYIFRIGDYFAINKFTKWERILPELPVTDLIINDSYLFDEIGTETKKIINPIDKNAIVLFQSLKNEYNDLKRVLVFTYINWKKHGCEKDDFDCTELKRIEFEKIIQKVFGQSVQVDLIRNTNEHDRYIFSNYFYINIGSSMNAIYDEKGNQSNKKKSSMRIMSYANISNFFWGDNLKTITFA